MAAGLSEIDSSIWLRDSTIGLGVALATLICVGRNAALFGFS
jgi:hypothetical protein